MNISRSFTLILAILMLSTAITGCAQIPDSVKNNSDKPNGETVDNVSSEYREVSEISKQADEYIQKLRGMSFDNVTVTDDLELCIPTAISDGEYACIDNWQKDYEKIFTHYDNDFNGENIVDDTSTYPYGPIYTNAEKGLELSVGCTGYFSYIKDFNFDMFEANAVKNYSSAQAEGSDKKYQMAESDVSLSPNDALKIAQDFVDEFVAVSDYPNGIKVENVTLEEYADGYIYYVEYTQSVDGVNLLSYPLGIAETDKEYLFFNVFAYICSDEINDFCVNAAVEQTKALGNIESVPDPQQALEIVSGELAENMALEVCRISLDRCMLITERGEDAEEVGGSYCSGDKYEQRLCWVFYFDETPNQEVFALFDCQTHEVIFVNNAAQ